jgi:flagellar biosynthesis protein FliR
MELELSQVTEWVSAAALPLGRVAGLVMVAPIFSSKSIPRRVRAAFVVMLTIVLIPLAPRGNLPDALSLSGMAVMVEQVAIGVMLGFILRVLFEAVAFGGELVGIGMGLSFGRTVDPSNGTSTPVASQLYMMLATLLFLAMNGHLELIRLLASSFTSLPPGAATLGRETFWAIAGLGSALFSGAVRVALPAMIALLVVNLGFGVMSRAAPSLNLFAIGFPVTLIVGLLMMWLSLGSLAPTFTMLVDHAFSAIRDLLGMP